MQPNLASFPGITAPALATAAGITAATAGVWLAGINRHAGKDAGSKHTSVAAMAVPFIAGILLGVALFGLLPELVLEAGWGVSLLLSGAGYGLLIAVDRYVHDVCPISSHTHKHSGAAGSIRELHGFAAPLLAAAAIHSFLDGWSVATSQAAGPLGLRVAVPLAVSLHKVPEGIALGGIVCAAMGSATVGLRMRALIGCILAEGCTLAGAVMGLKLAPQLGEHWVVYPLGLTAGWIFYLGFHAVQEEWKHRGAFVSALTGLAGAAAIQRGAEAFFR